MTTLISVIIPTFNRAIMVQQAVASVLQQRGDFKFEVIVVDDGSTTETELALKRFGDAIRYVRQDNAGLNPARNHGLRLATGDYIALLDDDDVWLPFKTALLMRALREFPQAGFVHSNFTIWKPANNSRRPDGLRSWFPRPFTWAEMYAHRREFELTDATNLGLDRTQFTAHAGEALYYWSLFAPMVLPSTAIVRREALGADMRFPEIDSVGDWEFFARLSKHWGAAFVAEDTTLNRSHEDAVRLTRTDPSLRLRRRIKFIQRLWRQDPEFMQSKGKEVSTVEAQCLRKLAKLCIAGGKNADAREALKELRGLGAPFTSADAALWMLSRVPFVGRAAVLLHALKIRMRSTFGAAS